jgi:hypothetical protein
MSAWSTVLLGVGFAVTLSACAEMLQGPDGVARTQAAVLAAGAAVEVGKEKEQEPENPEQEDDKNEGETD